jgi:hypothetical protein
MPPNPYAYLPKRVANLHKNDRPPQPPVSRVDPTHMPPGNHPTGRRDGMAAGRHQAPEHHHFRGALRHRGLSC